MDLFRGEADFAFVMFDALLPVLKQDPPDIIGQYHMV